MEREGGSGGEWRNGGSRGKEERREGVGNGLGEERPGQGEGQIMYLLRGAGGNTGKIECWE